MGTILPFKFFTSWTILQEVFCILYVMADLIGHLSCT